MTPFSVARIFSAVRGAVRGRFFLIPPFASAQDIAQKDQRTDWLKYSSIELEMFSFCHHRIRKPDYLVRMRDFSRSSLA